MPIIAMSEGEKIYTQFKNLILSSLAAAWESQPSII